MFDCLCTSEFHTDFSCVQLRYAPSLFKITNTEIRVVFCSNGNCHDIIITEILLKVVLNTINLNLVQIGTLVQCPKFVEDLNTN
jgi:hypothetical protein